MARVEFHRIGLGQFNHEERKGHKKSSLRSMRSLRLKNLLPCAVRDLTWEPELETRNREAKPRLRSHRLRPGRWRRFLGRNFYLERQARRDHRDHAA